MTHEEKIKDEFEEEKCRPCEDNTPECSECRITWLSKRALTNEQIKDFQNYILGELEGDELGDIEGRFIDWLDGIKG